MLRIAICDDDQSVLDRLTNYLMRFSFGNNRELEIRTYSTAEELLGTDYPYQVLFLDIMLNDEQDGIELAKQLRKDDCTAIIIIISSRTDKHADACEAAIFRYLIKPITQERLDSTIDNVLHYLQKNNRIFPVHFGGETEYIQLTDIIFIESYARKRYVYTKRKILKTTETWKNLLERTKIERCFFRPQKMILINMQHIQSNSKSELVMDNDRIVTLSKGSYYAFQAAYNSFLGEMQ